MGQRVARLVRDRMLDYIEFDDGFAMVKTEPPAAILEKTLADAHVRVRYGITVVGVKRPGKAFTYATPETIVEGGDVIIASGPIRAVERFSELT